MGSGELPAGTRQRVRGRDRRQGHGRDDAVGRLPDQGLHRVQRQGRAPTTWSSATGSGSAPASTGGHYVDLTDFFNEHNLGEVMAPATVKYYAEYPATVGQVLGGPGSRATPSAGPTARTGSRIRRRWKPSRPSTATTSPCRRPGRQLRDIAEFFHRPDENRYGIAIYTDNSYDAPGDGLRERAVLLRRRPRRLRDLRGRRHHQLRRRTSQRSRPTRSSTASRRRAGPRPSSSRTTRPSPKAWRR